MAQEHAGVPDARRLGTLRLGRWRLGWATVGAVALTVVVALVALGSILKLREDAQRVAHTEEVIAALGQALVLTVDAETAQRGFLLTGNADYLQPYRHATRTILLELDRLRRLVADNPLQSGRGATLATLTQQRIEQVDRVIELQMAQGFEAARTAVAGGEGKQLQDRIRELVAQMRAEEERLLGEREARSDASARLAVASIALGALLSIAIAITAAVRLEARNEELARANAAKSDFLARMSHEIRTPMNAIVGLTQLLARQPMTADQLDMVQRIGTAGRSLTALINDILDLSKIEAGHLRLERRGFALGPLLMQLDSLLGPTARQKGIALRLELPAGDVPGGLVGDAQRLEQVLVNLIGNAVKFTEQGEVVVRLRVVAQDAAGLTLRFEVADTGIGIAPHLLDGLFQPFTQGHVGTQRRYGGTGLGLSIAKQLVELMGGRIGAHSTLGLGSTFWFELPLERAAAGDVQQPVYAAQPPTAALQPRLAGLHVLTVDDNDTNLDLTERALRLEGARATLARDGQQAVQALRAQPEGFDAVLMDLQMPVMDGLTATRTIRQELGMAALPIIVFSASVLPRERDEALEAGATDFLAKPVDIEQLVAVLVRHGRVPAALAGAAPGPAPWPAIDGIDATLVRAALQGDFDRFLQLCAQFMAQAVSAPAEVSAALDRQDAQAALAALHAVRGAALTLGAKRLAAAVAALEDAIDAGQPAREPLRAYAAELAALQGALAPWQAAPRQARGPA
ncbi:CHASE3 domain-containing protein [Azohydromonas aeria]|uniref:CHASE3 domain-containing protein n=1 Tax=Azohydromonas aeria TaxID=2590212 RepID=UPI0012F87FB1|nr:CHASE3 domain-containing protein [Azohydromonas aeria]